MLNAVVLALAWAGPSMAGEVENQVLGAVNAARARAGCGALRVNTQLQAAARGHAKAMAEKNFFSHESKNGGKFSGRFKAQGYHYRRAAENIAAGQKSASDVVNVWLHSAGHRKNILDCSLTETGIGVVYQPDDAPIAGRKYAYKYYWVQDFGRP